MDDIPLGWQHRLPRRTEPAPSNRLAAVLNNWVTGRPPPMSAGQPATQGKAVTAALPCRDQRAGDMDRPGWKMRRHQVRKRSQAIPSSKITSDTIRYHQCPPRIALFFVKNTVDMPGVLHSNRGGRFC